MENPTPEFDDPLETLRKIDALFVDACELRDLMAIVKHDMATQGYANRELSNKLIGHARTIKAHTPYLKEFVAKFEPGAEEFDARFEMDQSGVVNWLPLAQAHFVLENYSRSSEIFADVIQRFDLNAEFEQRLADARLDYATVLRVEGRFGDAARQQLHALEWFDSHYPVGHEETLGAIKSLTATSASLDDGTLQGKVFAKLLHLRAKHDLQVEHYIDSLKLAALVLSQHQDLPAQPLLDELQELVLSRTRACLGLLVEHDKTSEARAIAQFSLPLYERLFGADDDKTSWLRKMGQEAG